MNGGEASQTTSVPYLENISYYIRGNANRKLINVLENGFQLIDVIEGLIDERNRQGNDNPFIVCDVGEVVRSFELHSSCLPGVRPYYAIKANHDDCLSQLLFDLGTGFDCASQGEIEKVQKYGAGKCDIIFASPIKFTSHIKYCHRFSVPYMTFDTVDELEKMVSGYPSTKPILRINVDGSHSQLDLSDKFGASVDEIRCILSFAKERSICLYGVSFHVGSRCSEPSALSSAIKDGADVLKKIITMVRECHGDVDEFLLDIGGGFPGHKGSENEFKELARACMASIKQELLNIKGSQVNVITEPGTLFTSACMSLVCNVIGKRRVESVTTDSDGGSTTTFQYYLNDGVHGTFSEIAFGRTRLYPELLRKKKNTKNSQNNGLFKSTLWGPTPDSLDVISKDMMLPEMEIGDDIIFHNMGDYGQALSSANFGGVSQAEVIYVVERKYKEHFYHR